jgi:hypothetical protein
MHKKLYELSQDIERCEKIVDYARLFGHKVTIAKFNISRFLLLKVIDNLPEWRRLRALEEQEQNN